MSTRAAQSSPSNKIWIAEDDDDHYFLLQKILNESPCPARIHRVVDGEELMLQLTSDEQEKPCMIILDINMPRKDGWEALQEIRAHPTLKRIPVIVLSTSDVEEDKFRSYELGANSYIRKPIEFKKWVEVVDAINRYWFGAVELPEKGEPRND